MKTRIVTNPKIRGGKPVVAGTRIPVTLILNLLVHGQTIKQIIDDYPDLEEEDIKAAVRYAERAVEKDSTQHISAIAHEISAR